MRSYSTITPRTVSDQNESGGSPGSSVSTSNSSCSRIMHRDQSWASRPVNLGFARRRWIQSVPKGRGGRTCLPRYSPWSGILQNPKASYQPTNRSVPWGL